MITQAIAIEPVEVKTCSSCTKVLASRRPHFNNFQESNGRGWCKLFNLKARAYNEQVLDCIVSSDLAVSVKLEDNLALFPDVNFEELQAFPTREIIDEADKPHSEYEVGSIVKVIDKDEHHEEWGVFEVIECLHNKYTYDRNHPEAYLNHVEWHYRLSSYTDGNTIPSNNFALDKSLWVRENEICDFDMAHNICTEEIF